MSVIYKYTAAVVDQQEVMIPKGSVFLSAQAQGNEIALWFWIEDREAPKEPFSLYIYGTGNPIEEPLDELLHLDTVQTPPFVWHLFERVKY